MKRSFFLLASFIGFITFDAASQTKNPETKAVEDVIHRLFESMQKGDSAMFSTVFSHDVTLATLSVNKEGSVKLEHESSVKDFKDAVAAPHKDTWYEETWNYTTQLDGAFAQVWCDYGFYLGNRFSHCGVDAFQLAKINGEWKIFHLADTRRTDGCKVPDAISKKHK